jgi:uncharacterized protein (DUF1501 family)
MKFSRRQFMEMSGIIGLSSALFPAWMPRLAFASQPEKASKGDILVVISLRGGMDGLAAVAPYAEGAAYYDMRPTIAPREPGSGADRLLDLNGKFGLHPALRPLYPLYQEKKLAVVHAVGSPDPTRSHFTAMEYMERGTPGQRALSSGWLNRHLQTLNTGNDSPLRAVGFGDMLPISLNGVASSVSLKSISDFHLGGDEEGLAGIQQTLTSLYSTPANPLHAGLTQQAGRVFNVMDILGKLSATEYTPEHNAIYPDTDYGYGLKQIAQLIKAEVGLEVACIDIGGWDTHENQADEISTALTELAEGIAAFYTDLDARMKRVTVITLSEFGRRLSENGSAGTDHGHGNVMFALGGSGVNGGVYAKWPGLKPDQLDDGDLAITTDYRSVLSELLTARVGNPAVDQVFPGFKASPLGLFKQG